MTENGQKVGAGAVIIKLSDLVTPEVQNRTSRQEGVGGERGFVWRREGNNGACRPCQARGEHRREGTRMTCGEPAEMEGEWPGRAG